MPLLDSIKRFTGFGYDAVQAKNKRKAPVSQQRGEDAELTTDERGRLVTTGRDLARNFALARWMVARHLDYVTTFSFQAKTGNDALDTRLEKIVAEDSQKENNDIAGRHNLRRMIRLTEARKVIDGDCGILRVSDGRLQAIEGDRIRNPGEMEFLQPVCDPAGRVLREWVHGVEIDGVGRALRYAVCRRNRQAPSVGGQFVLDRYIDSANLYLHAGFERFDQVRGASEISSAINTLRDTYEGFDFALAKMKVSQLFGLSIFRESSEGFPDPTANTDDDTTDSDAQRYKIDFGQGPFMVDLDPGDRAEFLESKSPSLEFQGFAQTMIAVALKALNIPYCFYAENFTNYSGSRLAYLQYEAAAANDRDSVADLLNWITVWRLLLAMGNGRLPGASVEQVLSGWGWVHKGMPWLDPLKETFAELQAIGSGLDNYEDVAQRHNRNFFENIDKIKRCRDYADSQGVKLVDLSRMPTKRPGGGR